jgi:hypothetical protein
MNILAILNVGLALFGFVLFWGQIAILIFGTAIIFCFPGFYDSLGLAGKPMHPLVGSYLFFGFLYGSAFFVVSKCITSFIHYRLDPPDLNDICKLGLNEYDSLVVRNLVLIDYDGGDKAGMWGERTCDHAMRCLNAVRVYNKLNGNFETIATIIILAIIFVPHIVKSILHSFKHRNCTHDEVRETMACDAICRKCGKDLGFIGNWRESRGKHE